MNRHGSGSAAVGLLLLVACLAEPQGAGCSCARERSEPATTTPSDPPTSAEQPPPSGAETAPAAESVPAPLPDFDDPAWTRVTSRAGKYVVCWRALSGKVPRNEDFTLEAWVLRDGAPVRGAELGVSAWMPDHGHGMLRQPRIEAQEDGSFRAEGMLLHMRGHWQLMFEVLEGSLSETAECALEL